MTHSTQRAIKWLIPVVVVLLLALLWHAGLLDALSLQNLKHRQGELAAWTQANPWWAAAGFLVIYVGVTGASLPGAAILTIAGVPFSG